MIHVCYAMRDESGKYSKFIGTSMLSIFENTHESVTIHLIHDSTLTEDNRKKFLKLVYQFEQDIKFYNVDELLPTVVNEINLKLPQLKNHWATVAALYRLMIPELIDESKMIYLDGDTIINLDIDEFWNVDLKNFSIGAVPESFSGYTITKRVFGPIKDGIVAWQDYFNSGVLYMNLDELRGGGESLIQ